MLCDASLQLHYMITYLQGRITEKFPDHVVVECGGIGYLVQISLNTYSKIQHAENYKLLTHFSIRENVHTGETTQSLFGFAEHEERALFRLLITVSGISESKARIILSSFTSKELQQIIAGNDVNALATVKGLGQKTAQKVIAELRDKVLKDYEAPDTGMIQNNRIKNETISALVALGFDKYAAEKAFRRATDQTKPGSTVEEVVKSALKFI